MGNIDSEALSFYNLEQEGEKIKDILVKAKNFLESDQKALLDSVSVTSSDNTGKVWGYIPVVKTDGGIELGKYIDMHIQSNDGIDRYARVIVEDNGDGIPVFKFEDGVSGRAHGKFKNMIAEQIHGTHFGTLGYPLKMTLNGVEFSYACSSTTADSFASGVRFYAPVTVGTANQVLVSNGSGAPTWSDTAPLATSFKSGTMTISFAAFYGAFTAVAAKAHTHDNKGELDKIQEGDVEKWNDLTFKQSLRIEPIETYTNKVAVYNYDALTTFCDATGYETKKFAVTSGSTYRITGCNIGQIDDKGVPFVIITREDGLTMGHYCDDVYSNASNLLSEDFKVNIECEIVIPSNISYIYVNNMCDTVEIVVKELISDYLLEVSKENLSDELFKLINNTAAKTEVHSAFSNALKGSASGAIIALNDVSPVEHEVECVVTSETVAPTTVNVSKYGKNISPSGTLTVQGTIAWKNDNVRCFLPAGKYVVSCNYEQTGTPSTIGMRVAHKDTEATVIQTKATDISGTLYVAFELTESKEYKVYLYANYSSTALEEDAICEFTNIQIEVDNGTGTPTAYEEPVVYSYTPDAEGRIDGMTSISPYMTLVTDTPDACVEVVYNKDVNKAFEEAKTTLKDYVDEAILNGEW